MARGLTDYLNDDLPKQDGDQRKNASGSDSSGQVDGENYDGGIPARWPMPENAEYGYGKDGNSGGFGHSDDCKYVGQKAAAWGMSKNDIAKGYEAGESDGQGPTLGTRQPDGSHPQSIPSTNEWDRTHAYAKEHTETGSYDGCGQPESTSNPGGETIGSSKLPY
jgi:hypothetical protein